MEFPDVPEDFSALDDEAVQALHEQLVAAFAAATADPSSIDESALAELSAVADNVERLRTEQNVRIEAAQAREAQLASIAERVNATIVAPEPEPEAESTPESEPAPEIEAEAPAAIQAEAPVVADVIAQAEEVVADAPALEAVTAAAPAPAANLASLQRNAAIQTRPRPEAPTSTVSITAAVDVPGRAAGSDVRIDELGKVMMDRQRRLGTGNGDSVPVVTFHNEYPEERRLNRDTDVLERLKKFNSGKTSIVAAGGLCAPVNNYYDQMTVSGSDRPVKNALAPFNADRGGIRYNPPPTLTDISSGVGIVTAAQDLTGGGPATKGSLVVGCSTITEVDVSAVYNQLTFGNFSARAFPERVQAFTELALAAQARKAEGMLLDGIAAASIPVTAAGLVGAGRELCARIGQAAAGMRSRHRTMDVPITVLLPAWAADFAQADFSRTFTDNPGLISMDDEAITALFGVRDLNVSWYIDSKTGGGQIFGAADSGRTVTDGATNTNTTVTSATAAFTSADIGKTITGTGIPAGTTISAVASGTSITISAAATATATGVTLRIGAHVLQEFPNTVFAYLFFQGSFLHLDAGTLDLGLVRDSTLNSTNQFTTFTESFENVALVGPESLELALNLNADGTYGAAKAITNPIVT